VTSLLVVDDDPDLSEILGELLRGQGFEVRTAGNGEEGIERVTERRPDLILLDVEMPRLTGPEMASRLSLDDQGAATIPIILVAGVTNLSSIAESVGTPYFLRKPYDFEVLLKVISQALRERRAPVRRAGSVVGPNDASSVARLAKS
jgi:CheY-like chemotaxis protein